VTKLGELARGPASAPAASRFSAALAGRQVFVDVELPRLGLRGKMRLIGAGRTLDIEGQVVAAMASRGLTQDVLTQGDYETERALRTLAEAVRDPDDVTKPLGTVDEWAVLDIDAIAEVWRAYGDLREQHDPVAAEITAADWAAIREALEKKSAAALRFFGVRKLAVFMTTSGGPLPTSPTPRSSPGASSPASSSSPAPTTASPTAPGAS
jgi:hypothetical protein